MVFVVTGPGEGDHGRHEQRREEGAQPPRPALPPGAEAAQLSPDVQRRETQTRKGNCEGERGGRSEPEDF